MSIQKNIGKNTIGDNNKMSVNLHEYSMSTHDLSTIVRNTQSPGTLVPNLCLIGQKGDTFDIDVDAMGRNYPSYFDRNNCNHYYTLCAKLHNEFKRQQKQSKLNAKNGANNNVKR